MLESTARDQIFSPHYFQTSNIRTSFSLDPCPHLIHSPVLRAIAYRSLSDTERFHNILLKFVNNLLIWKLVKGIKRYKLSVIKCVSHRDEKYSIKTH